MKVKGFLLVNEAGSDTKFLVKEPATQRGEIAIAVDLDIPNALFRPLKLPTVQVTIDDSVIPQIRVINEHCEALQEAGIKIRLVDDREG